MGSWGEKLFSDDTACDVRDEWKDRYSKTGDAKGATAATIKSFADDIKGDPDEAANFWLALAVTEHKHGFGTPKVLKEARRILTKRLGMGLWEDEGPKAVAARTREYDRIAEVLDAPRPPVKPFKLKKTADSGLKSGDVFRLPLAEGPAKWAYFRVLDVSNDTDERSVTVELLDVPSSRDPTPEVLAKAKSRLLRVPGYIKVPRFKAANLSGWRARAFDRKSIERVASSPPRKRKLEYDDVRTTDWDQLAIIARWSLDSSPYMDGDEAAAIAMKTPVSRVADAMQPARFQRYIDARTYEVAAEQLMLKHHDYERADKLLDLAEQIDHFGYDYSLLRGLAFMGLGRAQEAEQLWSKYLSRFSSKRRSDYQQQFFDKVDAYRKHAQSR